MANLSNINNKFLVTTGGDVGINTTSPGATLDVSGTNAVVWVNPGAGSHAGVNFRQGSVFKGWVGLNNTTGCINLSRDGSIAAGINVDSSNNVGIGLTSPTEKLDVEGNIQAINTAGSSVAYVDIVSGATWRLASNPTSGTNASFIIQAMDISQEPQNSEISINNNVLVRINKHFYRSGTGI